MTSYPNTPYSHKCLTTFEAVARHMSFTQAADELNVTQGAVSRQIRQLEEYCQQTLIIRKQRYIELSDKGQQLAQLLTRSYGELEQLFASWKQQKGRRIVIKSAMSFATRVLMPRLPYLVERYPQYEIIVVPTLEEELTLTSGDYDLAIFFTRKPMPRHDIEFLRDEYMSPVCATRPDQAPVTIDDVLAQPRLHPTDDHTDWRSWLEQIGHRDGESVRNSTLFTLDLALSACLSGQGVTVTDMLLVLPELQQGFLTSPKQTIIYTSPWKYYCHQPQPSEITQEIASWLRQVTAQQLDDLTALAEQNQWQIRRVEQWS